MIKQHKKQLLITSFITLLPLLAGLALWRHLPARLPTHWGFDGQIDRYSSRAFTVFALPLFLLAVHWLCILATTKDPKNHRQNPKIFRLLLWVCPATSLLVGGMSYYAAFQPELRADMLIALLLGLLFAALGNYLPKCRQNSTIGIRLKWTLASEENWNATHRFCGKVWLAGGILMMLCAFLPEALFTPVFMTLVFVISFLPIFYSYIYHKQQQKSI